MAQLGEDIENPAEELAVCPSPHPLCCLRLCLAHTQHRVCFELFQGADKATYEENKLNTEVGGASSLLPP